FSNMVMAGEEAGKLEDLLEKLAEIYEMDVEYALKSFTAALEPLMVFVTGGVIGFIILAVFLPLYGVLNNI
ncbi:MAG: type II secretion system F family protein, partial [Armatimonadetes bacterium]|nr:type II secretion system F family protein [Armatimonadota bacterium]